MGKRPIGAIDLVVLAVLAIAGDVDGGLAKRCDAKVIVIGKARDPISPADEADDDFRPR